MERCREEFCAPRHESKRQERTRDEQLSERPVGLLTLLAEHGHALEAVETAEALAQFTRQHIGRLSAGDFERFTALMLSRHGAAMVRRAGLPTGAPRLRVA